MTFKILQNNPFILENKTSGLETQKFDDNREEVLISIADVIDMGILVMYYVPKVHKYSEITSDQAFSAEHKCNYLNMNRVD